MVYFTCNHCGDSVKKPSVEKHYMSKCRNSKKSLSCMDCNKDFYNEEYDKHTKCISEEQRYSGKNYVPKASKNSGEKKQEDWTVIIRSILDSKEYNFSQKTRHIFQRLKNYENVPRKQKKFNNFVENSLHLKPEQIQEAWMILEKELEKIKAAKGEMNQLEQVPNENGVNEDDSKEGLTDKDKEKNNMGSEDEEKLMNTNKDKVVSKNKKKRKSEKEISPDGTEASINGPIKQKKIKKGDKDFSPEITEETEKSEYQEAATKKSKKRKRPKVNGAAEDTTANGVVGENMEKENGKQRKSEKVKSPGGTEASINGPIKQKKIRKGDEDFSPEITEETEKSEYQEAATKKSKKRKRPKVNGAAEDTTANGVVGENMEKENGKQRKSEKVNSPGGTEASINGPIKQKKIKKGDEDFSPEITEETEKSEYQEAATKKSKKRKRPKVNGAAEDTTANGVVGENKLRKIETQVKEEQTKTEKKSKVTQYKTERGEETAPDVFSWRNIICNIVQESDNLKLNTLKEKVFGMYLTHIGIEKTKKIEMKFKKKFHSILIKCNNLQVENDVVKVI